MELLGLGKHYANKDSNKKHGVQDTCKLGDLYKSGGRPDVLLLFSKSHAKAHTYSRNHLATPNTGHPCLSEFWLSQWLDNGKNEQQEDVQAVVVIVLLFCCKLTAELPFSAMPD